jgi:hypothetical protein
MGPVCLCLLLLFAAETQPPELPQVRYPVWKQKDDIKRRVDAHLTLQMEIAADGAISRVIYLEQEKIPEDQVEGFVLFFRTQLEGRKAKPAFQDGKAVACTYKYIFVWPLFVPPPEKHHYPDDYLRQKEAAPRGGEPAEIIKLLEVERLPYIRTPDGREIPLEQFRSELDAAARRLMDARGLRQVTEGPMTLLTDDPSADAVAFYTGILKALPSTFARPFKPVLPDPPSIPAFKCYLFRSPMALPEFQKALGVPHWADGAYLGSLKILAASSSGGHPYRTREVLIHEETHFMVHELLTPKVTCPVWLNEGLAELFSGSRIDREGRMVFSAIDPGEYLDKRSGKVWIPCSALHRRLLWETRSRLKGILLRPLLSGAMDPREESTEEALRQFYAASWAFVRFLAGDEKTAVKPEFLDLLRAINEGKDARVFLLTQYGTTAEMEKAFWKAIKKW